VGGAMLRLFDEVAPGTAHDDGRRVGVTGVLQSDVMKACTHLRGGRVDCPTRCREGETNSTRHDASRMPAAGQGAAGEKTCRSILRLRQREGREGREGEGEGVVGGGGGGWGKGLSNIATAQQIMTAISAPSLRHGWSDRFWRGSSTQPGALWHPRAKIPGHQSFNKNSPQSICGEPWELLTPFRQEPFARVSALQDGEFDRRLVAFSDPVRAVGRPTRVACPPEGPSYDSRSRASGRRCRGRESRG